MQLQDRSRHHFQLLHCKFNLFLSQLLPKPSSQLHNWKQQLTEFNEFSFSQDDETGRFNISSLEEEKTVYQ